MASGVDTILAHTNFFIPGLFWMPGLRFVATATGNARESVANTQQGRALQRMWLNPKFGFATVAAALAFAVAAVGLAQSPRTLAEGKDNVLEIVATTSMIADAAKAVGGEHVSVTALMGPGVDPHAYRQTRSDIVRLVKAGLVLWNGLYLEAQMEQFFADLGKRHTVVAVGEAVPEAVRIAHQDYNGRFDPHVWMDPELWRTVVEKVRDAMISVAPEHRQKFEANAVRYLSDIEKVANYAKSALATVPSEQRVLITAHDAFNYFGRAYGFEVIGIQGISTESEAGLNRIRELVDTIVDRDISAVFVETSVAERNIRAVIEGAAARGHTVRVGGELFSDAMGRPETYEGTYLGMIDHNATVIARALGGSAPERGMAGRLAVSG